MTKIPVAIKPKSNNLRSCDGCTKCCEGWLTANIRGHEMYPGKPCFFIEQGIGCKDYENRPEDPCKTFFCDWRMNEDVPLAFKPSEIGTIFTIRDIDGMQYYAATDAGNPISAEVVSWLTTYAVGNFMNVEWFVDDRPYFMGSSEFCQVMSQKHSEALDN